MKRKFMLLTALAALCCSAWADGLVVQDISIPMGGESTLLIALENSSTEFSAFQFNVQLAEGITVAVNEKGRLVYEKGDRLDEDFTLSMSQPDPEVNFFRVLGYYTETHAIAGTKGVIVKMTLKADASLAEGNSFVCKLTGINLTEPNETKHTPDDITFNVTIKTKELVILDETSSIAPVKSDDEVDVKVKRTIKANEWSTLVLPFDMTELQLKEALGYDVQLAEFTDYEAEYDDDDNVTGLTVNFSATDLSEGFYGNYPYLVKTSKDITEFLVTVTIDPKETDAVAEYDNGKSGKQRKVYGSLIGTYHAGDAIPANGLFLSSNKFWYSTGKTKIMAYRAYFIFNDVLSGVNDAAVKMVVNIDDEETKVEGISSNVCKGAVYDLSGRKLERLPQKGIFIENGKKVMK